MWSVFFIWGKGIEKGRGEGNDWPLGTVVAGEKGDGREGERGRGRDRERGEKNGKWAKPTF